MVDECNDTRIHGLRGGQRATWTCLGVPRYLFGWNAMPFALEDLDSNYGTSISSRGELHVGVRAFVNIEEDMLIGVWGKPQLRSHPE